MAVKTIKIQERDIEIQAPLGGLLKKYAIQKFGAFTTQSCSNVRPRNIFNGRTMLGSRSGLIQHDKIGTANPYTFINDVDYLKSTTANFFADSFDQPAVNTVWAAPTGSVIVKVANGYAYADANDADNNLSAVRAKPTGIDLTAQYKIRMYIVPYKGSFGGAYDLHAGLNDSVPDTDVVGVRARMQMSGTTGAYALTISKVIGSVRTNATTQSGTMSVTKAGWYEMWVTGDFTAGAVDVAVYWQGTLIDSQTYNISAGATAGNKLGFGLAGSGGSNRAQIAHFRLQYAETSATNRLITQLVCASNGTLYRESSMNSLIFLSSNYSLASDRTLQTQQRAQKLYIADNKIKAAGANGIVQNTYLAVSTIALTNGVVTITTSTAHHAVTGMKVTISNGIVAVHGINYTVDGQFTITSTPSTTTFTYTKLNPTTPGVVKVTNGSANITGIGTNFDPVIAAGDVVQINSENKTILSRAGAADTAAVATTTFSADADGQILYLDLPATSVTGTRAIIVGNVFDSASYSDWTTLSLSTYDDVVQLGASAGGLPENQVIAGTYGIAEIAAGALYLTSSAVNDQHPTSSEAYGTVTFSVGRTPKIYDPSADTLTPWATETYVYNSQDISSISRTNNLVTVTTLTPHLLQAGWNVTISSQVQNALFNGTFPIASVTALTFTYELVGEDVVTQVAASNVIKASLTGNVVTITTRAVHNLAVGMNATVALAPSNTTFDGTWYVASTPTSTTFTYAKTASDVTEFRTKGTVSAVVGTATQLSTTKGTVPFGCSIICLYRDRLILAGALNAAHLMYASRSGYPLDFDFTGDGNDPIRAYSGQETPQAGLIGKTITMLASWTDDYLLIGCKDSLWLQRGDLAAGGDVGPLSRTIGVISRDAWCRTPDGHFVFLSQDGLYGVPPGFNQAPASISRERLPFELLNVNTDNYNVLMAFDIEQRGIHIFLTPSVAGNATTGVVHWFFDWENKSFWPTTLMSSSYDPTAIFRHTNIDPFDSGVLLGCRDGRMRQFRDVCECDEGVAITSNCAFGPLRLWDQWDEGVLREIITTMATGSGSTTLAVYTGESEQAVYDSTTVFDSATLAAGRNIPFMPRMRGGAGKIVVSNSTTRAWAMESMVLRIMRGGRQRATA